MRRPPDRTLSSESDVVLIDLGTHNCGRLDAVAVVKRIRSKTQIVVLTFQEELGYIRAAVRRRADGYVAKRALNTDLLSAIRAVAQGRALVDVSVGLDSMQRATEPRPTVRCSRARRARPSMP